MAIPRFLHSNIQDHSEIDLDEQESHHANRVLRCKVGDRVAIFDGRGTEADGCILAIEKRCVRVKLGVRRFSPRDHSNRLHMALALPKGDRQRNAIERMVELGVDSLTPIQTERSIVSDVNIDRLNRYVVEASKQCRRNRFMEILPEKPLAKLLEFEPVSSIWFLHPYNASVAAKSVQEAFQIMNGNTTSVLFVVGPEGGFSDAEAEWAVQSGAYLLCLGERILRVETAVSVASVFGSQWLGNTIEPVPSESIPSDALL